MEFQIDDAVIKEDAASDVRNADEAALQDTFFILPVRLNIGGVEIFQREGDAYHWLQLPLLYAAAILRERVKNLTEDPVQSCQLPGGWELKLELKKESVIARSSINNREGYCHYKELANEMEVFAQQVKNFLVERAPEIKQHHYWGKWLLDRN